MSLLQGNFYKIDRRPSFASFGYQPTLSGNSSILPTDPYIPVAGFRKAASRPWFDSAPETLGALTNLFQYCFKSSHFFRARIGKNLSNFGGVFAKNRRDQFFAF